jgi:hypothetical protein
MLGGCASSSYGGTSVELPAEVDGDHPQPPMPTLADLTTRCAARSRHRSARAAHRGRARQEDRLHPDLRHHAPGAERHHLAGASTRLRRQRREGITILVATVALAKPGHGRAGRPPSISNAVANFARNDADHVLIGTTSGTVVRLIAVTRPTSDLRPGWSSRTSWPAIPAGAR